jgi:hypothetical protein
MAIQTRTAGTKTRAAKADASTVIRPRRSTRSTSRSPRGENVNNHLAELNLPGSRFDGGLTVLGKGGQGDIDNPNANSDAPGYLSPTIEKGNVPGPPDLPTGVDVQDEAYQATAHNVSPQGSETSDTQPSPRSRSVRTSDTVHAKTTIRGVTQGTYNSPETATRQLILMTSSRHSPTDRDPHEEGEEDPPTKERPREIHDQERKLYRVFSEDGMKETAYHVTDFAGFYPIWPIVEFSMAPTGATKDERMTSCIKCVAALLGKMVYVDDSAMITPIEITDDEEAHFLRSKSDIPSNFAKLGKHIMISGGSWVFTKKKKGSNNVYG